MSLVISPDRADAQELSAAFPNLPQNIAPADLNGICEEAIRAVVARSASHVEKVVLSDLEEIKAAVLKPPEIDERLVDQLCLILPSSLAFLLREINQLDSSAANTLASNMGTNPEAFSSRASRLVESTPEPIRYSFESFEFWALPCSTTARRSQRLRRFRQLANSTLARKLGIWCWKLCVC